MTFSCSVDCPRMAAVGVKRECYSLSGVESQTEESSRVLRRRSPELGEIVASGGGDPSQCVRHARRLVALAAKRNRRQVGRVRLDEDAPARDQAQEVVIQPLPE